MNAERWRRMIAPIMARIHGMVGRGVVKGVDDDRKLRTLQIAGRKNEVLGGAEHFEPLGFTCVPPIDAEVVYAAVGGNRDHVLALHCVSRPDRPTGKAEGDVTVYRPGGDEVVELTDGRIELRVGSTFLRVESGKVTISTPGGDYEQT